MTGTLNNATAGADEAVNKGLLGWTGGGGIAYAFAQNWNVFAEYRYTSFGTSTVSLPLSQLTTTSTTTLSAVEFGVNYKFTSGGQSAGAPPAPYPPERRHRRWSTNHRPLGMPTIGPGSILAPTAASAGRCRREPCSTPLGAPLTPYSYRVNGPVAGLFVGGNYQLNKIVLGVEGDWQWSNLIGNNQILAPLGAVGVFPGGPFTISTTVKDYAAVRGRVGLALDRFLVFGTGGWAWGNPLTSYALTNAAPFFNNGGSAIGWTAGLGVDYAFTDSVFGRIEYRYTSLATVGFVSAATNSAVASDHLPISDLRAGIAYKFGLF